MTAIDKGCGRETGGVGDAGRDAGSVGSGSGAGGSGVGAGGGGAANARCGASGRAGGGCCGAAEGKGPLTLKSDAVFRRVFASRGSEGVLAAFLSAVLGEEVSPDGLSVQDPSLKGHPDAKEVVVDVLARAADGRMMHVEVQLARPRAFAERIAYYTAGLLVSQLRRGERFEELSKVVSIVITDFPWRPGRSFASRYSLCSPATGEPFCDIMEVHTLELCKVPQDAGGLLAQWMRLIAATSYQELEDAKGQDPAIGEVVDMIWEMSAEERERVREENREKYRRDLEGICDNARDEGMAAGLAAGKATIIRAMLANGQDVASISSLTGLSEVDVLALSS